MITQVVRSTEPYQYTTESAADQSVIYVDADLFGINDARALVHEANTTSLEAATKLIVVRALGITLEAQQALLKIIEEPPTGSSLRFVVPPTVELLPTITSRVHSETFNTDTLINGTWEQFLHATYAERQKQIDAYQKTKNAEWLYAIRTGLLSYLESGVSVSPLLYLAAKKLQTRGAVNKWLLEALLLELPVE
jgi:hypothetical protein